MAILPERATQRAMSVALPEAIANRATSLVVTIQESKNLTHHLWKLVQLGPVMLRRLLWHTRAYGTVLIIGLLTLLSLIVLRLHWTYRKLLLVSTHQSDGGDKWHILSRKSPD